MPTLEVFFVESVVKSGSNSQGDKEISEGYKYFSEKYLFNISVHKLDNGCMVTARCHRSPKKNESPHRIEATPWSKINLYNPSKIDFPPVRELCEAVSKVDNSILMLSVCSSTSQETTDTKFGRFPKGSALGYQQKLSAHYILNILDEDFPILPIENFMLNTLQVALDRTKTTSLNAIQVSMDETRNIKVMTTLQSDAVRRDSLTASVAGDIVKRRAGLLSTKKHTMCYTTLCI
ncbi:unnamed protein product [Mytilus coruscus]|uniref:Uncharacterized protein n=1 Tax=Mytilus coruscus TaxID=42192 RepID=A0A6J7ZWE5_MYTCO|nr:unnamed protein product [Mytilus coruscus]